MLSFVREEEYNGHYEFYRAEMLRLSVFERSYPELKGKDTVVLARLGQRKEAARRMAELRGSVLLHEIYFRSFGERDFLRSDAVRREFGSESNLLSEIYTRALELPYGFAGIALCRGRLSVFAEKSLSAPYNVGEPLLALDVCEHAYYGTYGFDKSGYLDAALRRLRLDILDKLA